MDWVTLINGFGGPALSALFGVVGVILGRYIAQGIHKDGEEKLSSRVNVALTALFSLAVVGYVLDHRTESPLHLLGYGGAAGFVGLSLLEMLAAQFVDRIMGAFQGFMNPAAHKPPDGDDDETGISKAVEKLNNIH